MYIYKYTSTYLCTYISTHVHTYACVYLHTYGCTTICYTSHTPVYVCTYVHTQQGSLLQLTSSRKSPSFSPAASALESASTLATYCSPGTCTVGRNDFLARADAEGWGGEHTELHAAQTYVRTYMHVISR